MPLDVPRAQPTFIAGHDWAPLARHWRAIALGAAALGGLAVAAQLRALAAERRHPPEGRFITVDGVQLHYVERGSGRPVVLLHGMSSMLQDFTSSIVDELARSYRVIAFDRPGYGYSERPRRMYWTPRRQARLIHMAVTRLGVEKPIVVGHSCGALVALDYALLYPHQTAAIVLLGGYVFPVRLSTPAGI
jgi:pimeloyl-ACP methyl ester carboxylesterase